MSAFTYDAASGRYRAEGGRYVPDAQVRAAVDVVADASSERMAALAQRLRAGSMPLAEWTVEMQRAIKVGHLANGIAAFGGVSEMSASRYGYLGSRIKLEYQFLRQWSADIASGAAPLDGRLESRSAQYGQASRITFEGVRAREDRIRGVTEEKNVRHGSRQCRQCATLPTDWVPLGTLPPLGSRECSVNDRCSITRRAAPAA